VLWISALGINLLATGVGPATLRADDARGDRGEQLFPTTDPRGYLTMVTMRGDDGRFEDPGAWRSEANSRSVRTSTPNTSVTFSTKLPGPATDWRLGVTGGSATGPASGAYPVLVAVNELPTSMITLDASGGLDTQWTAIGQLTGEVRVTLTWGDGAGRLASTEPFNITAVQFARPFRDPEDGAISSDTSGPDGGQGFPARHGAGGSGGGTRGSSGGGGGDQPLPVPPPDEDPMTDPDMTPPDPPDRRTNDPDDPPPTPPSPPPNDPPGNPGPPPGPPPTPPQGPPPIENPPRNVDPPAIPSPGAVLPITLGALALFHRRRPVRGDG